MSGTKFYRTFVAESYPIEPQGEITFDESQELTTYYQAVYDDSGRVQAFIKFSREGGRDLPTSWVKAFSEHYEYWSSGRLKVRNLVRQDGTNRSWSYEDRPSVWTKSASEWFSDLQGGRTSAGPAERLLACHECVSQIESCVLEESFKRHTDIQWAVGAIAERVSDLKELFKLIFPDSNPRISLLAAESEIRLKSLPLLDEFFGLGPLVAIWDHLATLTTLEPADLTAAAEIEPDAREWLQVNDVESIWAVPIQACEFLGESQTEASPTLSEQGWRVGIAAHLVLWLSAAPSIVQAGAVISLFRRVGHFVQIVIELASLREPIGRNRDSGPLRHH